MSAETHTLTPLAGHVFVLTDVARTQTDSGLHLVQDWNPETTGQVAFIGTDTRCGKCGHGDDAPVEIGDRVLFSYLKGTEVRFEGTTYLSLCFDDLLAVFENGGS